MGEIRLAYVNVVESAPGQPRYEWQASVDDWVGHGTDPLAATLDLAHRLATHIKGLPGA